MRPAVKRRLVTLAAAASLLLCAGTAALWVRSYSVVYRLERVTDQLGDDLSRAEVGAAHGVVAASRQVTTNLDPRIRVRWGGPAPDFGPALGWGVHASPWSKLSQSILSQVFERPSWFGFSYSREETVNRRSHRKTTSVSFPLWLPVLLFAVSPMWWVISAARRRAKRHRAG